MPGEAPGEMPSGLRVPSMRACACAEMAGKACDMVAEVSAQGIHCAGESVLIQTRERRYGSLLESLENFSMLNFSDFLNSRHGRQKKKEEASKIIP